MVPTSEEGEEGGDRKRDLSSLASQLSHGDRLSRQTQLSQGCIIRGRGRVEQGLLGVKVRRGVSIVKWAWLVIQEAHVCGELFVGQRARVGVAEGAEGPSDGGGEGERRALVVEVQPAEVVICMGGSVHRRRGSSGGGFCPVSSQPEAQVRTRAPRLAQGRVGKGEGLSKHDGFRWVWLLVVGVAGVRDGRLTRCAKVNCRRGEERVPHTQPSIPSTHTHPPPTHTLTHTVNVPPSLSLRMSKISENCVSLP